MCVPAPRGKPVRSNDGNSPLRKKSPHDENAGIGAGRRSVSRWCRDRVLASSATRPRSAPRRSLRRSNEMCADRERRVTVIVQLNGRLAAAQLLLMRAGIRLKGQYALLGSFAVRAAGLGGESAGELPRNQVGHARPRGEDDRPRHRDDGRRRRPYAPTGRGNSQMTVDGTGVGIAVQLSRQQVSGRLCQRLPARRRGRRSGRISGA